MTRRIDAVVQAKRNRSNAYFILCDKLNWKFWLAASCNHEKSTPQLFHTVRNKSQFDFLGFLSWNHLFIRFLIHRDASVLENPISVEASVQKTLLANSKIWMKKSGKKGEGFLYAEQNRWLLIISTTVHDNSLLCHTVICSLDRITDYHVFDMGAATLLFLVFGCG